MLIHDANGFSLVELMISVVIMGVLLALGLPAFNTYIENTRLRNAAEVFLSAAESAKGNAASRNTQVEVILTGTTDRANLATAVASTTGAGWMVRTVDRVTYIEGRNLIEGGRGSQTAATVTGTVGGVTFTPLGGTTLAANATFAFTNPVGGSCVSAAPAGPMRCLNVTVSTTGRIKMCDPATVSPDTRACN